MGEVRNGSDLVLRQYLWANLAGGYVDELVQVAINDDPTDGTEQDCEQFYYALQNANFNVLGLIAETGEVVERYEYTPYGQRTVYTTAGSADPAAHTPTLMSQRVELAGVAQPYALNALGHQGLMHDEATGLIYNRARMLHPRLGRFVQRDPLGYVDGMGLYGYERSNPLYWSDPDGLATEITHEDNVTTVINRERGIGLRHTYSRHSGRYLGTEHFDPKDMVGEAIADLNSRNKQALADISDTATGTEIAGRTALAIAAVALPGPDDVVLGAVMGRFAVKKGWRWCGNRWVRRNGDDIPAHELDEARRELQRIRPWEGRPTISQAREEAKRNGWREVRDAPFNSHGQPVFTDGKKYYSADVDDHSGGTWKQFDRRGGNRQTLDR